MSQVRFRLGGEEIVADCEPLEGGLLRVRLAGGEPVEIRLEPIADGSFRALLGARCAARRADVVPAKKERWLLVDGVPYLLEEERGGAGPARRAAHGHEGESAAPMPGTLRKILVKPGDRVEKGQTVAILEAMKMEIPVAAARAGTVEAVLAEAGRTVEAGQEIVRIRKESP